ncbi:MAG: cytochrome c [Bryobacterales bacterium]|nr:cytochrome c [Bryobacterales bacterium]
MVLLLALWLQLFDKNTPERHSDILAHFKYGSIGAEDRAGIPYSIWRVLPKIFPNYLPHRPGTGYERLGFVYESGQVRPIGTSIRDRQVRLIGLNCAICHTGTVRDQPNQPPQIVLGMPAHQFDFQSYFNFLVKCANDPAFNANVLLAAIRQDDPDFGFLDALGYRLLVIQRTKDGILDQAKRLAFLNSRPPLGPGRVDTFNPYKTMFGFDMSKDTAVGAADLPSLWNQKPRDGLWLHWDGNNNLVSERNKSAAIGAGASDQSLDLDGMKRVEDWIWTLPPPPFPPSRIDPSQAAAGKALYDKHCADCHAFGGKRTGQVEPLAAIGTDPERVNSFTPELAAKMNTIGQNYPWKFTHFRKTEGYANMPLDGVWLRAPYLHNGSVPTLRDLLNKPEDRPKVFYRGYDVYDWNSLGFVTSGLAAERVGVKFDTSLKGNSNSGHNYATHLTARQKDQLLEFLKTQ